MLNKPIWTTKDCFWLGVLLTVCLHLVGYIIVTNGTSRSLASEVVEELEGLTEGGWGVGANKLVKLVKFEYLQDTSAPRFITLTNSAYEGLGTTFRVEAKDVSIIEQYQTIGEANEVIHSQTLVVMKNRERRFVTESPEAIELAIAIAHQTGFRNGEPDNL